MRFRKKPVVIEAVQFTNPDGPLPDGMRRGEKKWGGGDAYQIDLNRKYGPIYGFFIDTLEGVMEVRVGDWIITGVKGEKYPCKPDIFEMTYEPA